MKVIHPAISYILSKLRILEIILGCCEEIPPFHVFFRHTDDSGTV